MIQKRIRLRKKMALVSPELSLDLRPSFVPETINALLKELSMIKDVKEKLEKVNKFTRRLEDEMKKIQVFQRELPLCMLLLKDAILVLKQESRQYETINAHKPVLEEFMPSKKETDDENNQIRSNNNKADGEDSSNKDKKNWMSSFQLWSADDFPTSTAPNYNQKQKQKQNQDQTLFSDYKKGDDKINNLMVDELCDPSKHRAGSKRFVPMIHTYPSFPEFRRKVDNNEDVSMPGLSLLLPGIRPSEQDLISSGLNSKLGLSRISSSASPASNGQSNGQSNIRQGQQPASRKQRRCWSPELHRRFVDSLKQLGGPQVATPKQIRELMRVDGLTNDEVKSHLQKYRLHSRRVPNNSATSTNEIDNDPPKPSSSQSGSPEGPLQFSSMEDEEDEKSESYSWKGQVHTAQTREG